MGHSRQKKAENHARIVDVAARRFRERGVHGIGVADLMQEVELTHGGFYKHFESRDDLVAEAVERALADGAATVAGIEKRLFEGVEPSVAPSPARRKALWVALVDGYLSLAHRDDTGTSCAVTTLAGDVFRSGERARTAYAAQVNVYVGLFKELIAGTEDAAARKRALAALSMMVGAVSMARAVADETLSREILQSAANTLKGPFG